ncbi:ribonuclease Z [Oxyplasma meridianum]|uniref:Ribonuclease Z n=1 Tax=Oxyplasma meridianum TaxID=3073602 RepID=A0AAX4NG27_9ARCH
MASIVNITFLGTGGSWPFPGRGLPSIALQIDDTLNLLDCGEGTQKQIMKSNLSFMQIDNIFITHFHGDHFLGLLGLVQSMSFNGRDGDLNIYGPPGAISIISNALNVGYYSLNFRITVNELLLNEEYDFRTFTVTVHKNDHPVPAYSYRFHEKDLVKIDGEKAKQLGIPSRMLEKLRREGSVFYEGKVYRIQDVSAGIRKGRTVVYTGDTRPMEGMAEFARDADVLIHDTTTDSSLEPKVNEFGHSSSRQAAKIALKAGVKRFYLFHYSPRVDNVETLVEEARGIFPESYPSREILEYSIPAHKVAQDQDRGDSV